MKLDGSFREFEFPEGAYYRPSDSNYDPAFSPNRARLAFVRDGETWLAATGDLESARQVSLEQRRSYLNARTHSPVFAPDGRSLIYSNLTGDRIPSWEMVRYWPRSGKRAVSTEFLSSNNPNPDISPDGRLLAFVAQSTIRLKRFGGKGWWLPSPGKALIPSFSPDGRWLAYVSPVGEGWQVFVSRLDGSDRRQVTHELAPSGNVVFSPDGTMIAYRTGDWGEFELAVQDLRTGQSRIVEFPEPYVNLDVTEWPRTRLFEVLDYRRRPSRLRIRVFGRGIAVVRAGRFILGKRKLRRSGTHNIRVRRRDARGRIRRRVRVVFHPAGALPGSIVYRLRNAR